MVTQTQELSQFREMVQAFRSMSQYRKQSPNRRVDALFYELLADYHERILRAKEEGELLVAHGVMFPFEILHAMDIVPMQFHLSSVMVMFRLKKFEEVFSAGKGYGVTPETCSGHIAVPGLYSMGWVPQPDLFIWGNEPCDNSADCGESLLDICRNSRGFFLERPYRYDKEELSYYRSQLEDLVRLLEEISGRRMDWDRLSEMVKLSGRYWELTREIYQLKRAVPSPASNRWGNQVSSLSCFYWGTPEGIAFLELLRDEMKSRAERGVGYAPQERLRLMSIYAVPNYSNKILDWMQNEHGANIVADPDASYFWDWEPDPSRPLDSLARRYNVCSCGSMLGPLGESWLPNILSHAVSHKVDGAIFWANRGCRHGPAGLKLVSDRLRQEVGIPTVAIDVDLHDPSYVPEEEMKEKLEAFFEQVEASK